MNYKKLAVSAMLGWAFASPSAFANLITNGGFEADAVGGPHAASGFEYLFNPDLTDWNVFSAFRGVVLFNGTYAPGNVQGVGDGTNSLQIEHPGDYIEQTISTIIGTRYNISFLLNDYQPPTPGGMVTVTANGVGTTPSLFDGTPAWNTYLAEFIATSASTTIRFTSAEFYPQLDNISVEAIPEPATLALLGLGLAGLGFARRKQ